MTPLIALQGRTRAVALASATTLLAAAAVFPRAGAAADTYPSQPIRIEVPFGPGGVADISMRIAAETE